MTALAGRALFKGALPQPGELRACWRGSSIAPTADHGVACNNAVQGSWVRQELSLTRRQCVLPAKNRCTAGPLHSRRSLPPPGTKVYPGEGLPRLPTYPCEGRGQFSWCPDGIESFWSMWSLVWWARAGGFFEFSFGGRPC